MDTFSQGCQSATLAGIGERFQRYFRGCRLEGITVRDGGIQITDDPARFETYAEILSRHGLDEMTMEGESAPRGETSSADPSSPTGARVRQ
jgi:hypothetical protein